MCLPILISKLIVDVKPYKNDNIVNCSNSYFLHKKRLLQFITLLFSTSILWAQNRQISETINCKNSLTAAEGV